MITLHDIFKEIEAEFPHSVAKHPHAKWAEFRPTQMLPEVDGELDEIRDALVVHDFHGEHGVFKEINDAIIILLRMRMELERRNKLKGDSH